MKLLSNTLSICVLLAPTLALADAEDYDADEYGPTDFDAEYDTPGDAPDSDDPDPGEPEYQPQDTETEYQPQDTETEYQPQGTETEYQPQGTKAVENREGTWMFDTNRSEAPEKVGREAVFVEGIDSDAYRPDLMTPMGMSAAVGGGVTGFTQERARQFADTAGAWNARLVMGTRYIVGGEVAYLGSSGNVTALGLDDSAFLQSHGGEVAARLHLLPGIVQPYVLAGAGFKRYMLSNEDFNTSSIDEVDTIPHFPLGVGTAFRFEGFVVDARGVFRPTVQDDMLSEDSDMHTWGADLSLGAEF